MNKPVFSNENFTYNDLLGYGILLTALCLIVTWSLEILANTVFRLS